MFWRYLSSGNCEISIPTNLSIKIYFLKLPPPLILASNLSLKYHPLFSCEKLLTSSCLYQFYLLARILLILHAKSYLQLSRSGAIRQIFLSTGFLQPVNQLLRQTSPLQFHPPFHTSNSISRRTPDICRKMVQPTDNQNRMLMTAPRVEISRLRRFASHLSFFQTKLLRNHLGLRRMKKSDNLSGLVKAEAEPYFQIVSGSDNDYHFPQFAKFPVEIRLQIWKDYAKSLGPRDIPVWRIRNSRIDLATQLKVRFYDHQGNHVTFPIENRRQRHYDFNWSCPQPDILFINLEARQIGLEFYTQESLYGTPSFEDYKDESQTGPATIYRHRNGLDRIMPMFDLAHGHDHFWHEHKHQLEGLVALNAFLYDLNPDQPILPIEPSFKSTDPFFAREARERHALETAKAWAAVIPSTERSPAGRAIGDSIPFKVREITIYYRTDSLKGIKGI